MKPGILTLLCCALLAACASEDLRVTGISRECAIAIAEGSCSEYPQRYPYVERAVWLNGPRCWEVNLTDGQGRGLSYRINGHHRVIGVAPVDTAAPAPQPVKVYKVKHYWVQPSPDQNPPYSTPDDSGQKFYFRDGDYYDQPGR